MGWVTGCRKAQVGQAGILPVFSDSCKDMAAGKTFHTTDTEQAVNYGYCRNDLGRDGVKKAYDRKYSTGWIMESMKHLPHQLLL